MDLSTSLFVLLCILFKDAITQSEGGPKPLISMKVATI